MASGSDKSENSVGGRVKRYAQVSTGMGGFAARAAGGWLFGKDLTTEEYAAELRNALGGLKGPIMKLAQMAATIPDVLPEEFAAELAKLQSNAPAMGWPFVRRRMAAELGRDWKSKFASFDKEAAAAASLGQVHRAVDHDGRQLACKLQYPDMDSAVEADLKQLSVLLSIHRRVDRAIDTKEMAAEISARLREELDYQREAAHIALYGAIFADTPTIIVPETIEALSTKRLLTMTWLDGKPVLSFKDNPLEDRNKVAEAMFHAWWSPLSQYGVIHGDPHLGNYSITEDLRMNLLDYGCIRVFPAAFVQGVVDLYYGLLNQEEDRVVHAYEQWGFKGLSRELIDALNIWAGFIYGPMFEDRVRTVADGIKPSEYGRAQAFQVHQKLRELGPVRPPREFVFMERAAIGLGGVFLHLNAELNFYRLFNEAIDGFEAQALAARQSTALQAAGVPEQLEIAA